MKLRTLALAFLANLAAMGAAHAALVIWTLQNWVFDDGGTASGSFVFDADTGVYSDIMITTTTGSVRAGATYGAPIFPSFGEVLFAVPATLPNLTGSAGLGVTWASALTNAGGAILVALGSSFAGEYTCGGATCDGLGAPFRTLTSGLVATTPAPPPVPLPAALPLFLAGLAGLGLTRRAVQRLVVSL